MRRGEEGWGREVREDGGRSFGAAMDNVSAVCSRKHGAENAQRHHVKAIRREHKIERPVQLPPCHFIQHIKNARLRDPRRPTERLVELPRTKRVALARLEPHVRERLCVREDVRSVARCELEHPFGRWG